MTTRTSDPAALASQHRQAQLQIRARLLRDFLILWPIWTGDDASYARLVQATLSLVAVYRRGSATLAGHYYVAARATAGEPGFAAVEAAAAIDPEQLTRSMYVTGRSKTRVELADGQPFHEVQQKALTRTSGAVTRHVLDGGRQTILDTVAKDERAVGWARITDGDPCYFCLTLASRGAVYKSEQTADFQAHDHCSCSAMALWEGTQLPDATDRWRQIYDDAQQGGLDDGTLQHGENTSTARLNAVRRYLAKT